MDKHIAFEKEATDKMIKGVLKLSRVVGKTLGADGKIIFFEHPFAKIPVTSKDGATVASWIELEDRFENMGAGMVKYAANKTMIEAGDGTTTTTIIGSYLIEKGMEAINGGAKSRHIHKGMELGAKIFTDYIKEKSKQITPKDKLVKKVAMVSSNYDEEISDMITHAVSRIGKGAVINVHKHLGGITKLDLVEGMTVQSGYTHPVFVNNNHNECVLENVAIIICDYEITKMSEIVNIFKSIELNAGTEKPKGITREPNDLKSHRRVDSYLFIARDVQGEALSSLAKSKVEGNSPIAIARPPGGDNFDDLIRDIAIFTGGKVIAENEGYSLENMNAHSDCGWAKKITLSIDSLSITEGEAKQDEFIERVNVLNNDIQNADNPQKKKLYEQRLARLSSSVAKLTVGGDNDAMIQERADLADDAHHAVRSAMKEGIIVGGGISYLKASVLLENPKEVPENLKEGFEIMRKALYVPLETILDNSGFTSDEKDQMVSDIYASKGDKGYNALTDSLTDLFKDGIVDPVKVLRCAVENAVGVTGQILNAGAALYQLKEIDGTAEAAKRRA